MSGSSSLTPKAKAYLSITARAEVRRDHAKAAEIWKSTDNMWWKRSGRSDVCVLRVRPLTAELWDGPASAAVAAFEFAKARITGAKPNLGENRKVTVRMTRAAVPAQIRDPRTKTAEHDLPDHLEGNPRPQADRLQL